MARKGGSRRSKRTIFTKSSRDKGKTSIRKILTEYKEGQKVNLLIEPSMLKGLYHPRFAGKTGTIISKKGECYEVKITDMDKQKTLIVHPIHLEIKGN
ncbi:50S ribosomal protein L21e [Candidatus Woesearchaeota archaeon]|nr:50S ribosomal protein L21e [Candidatus Woesearchaeota archaeon]